MSNRWKSRTVALCALVLGLFTGATLSALVAQGTMADAQPAVTVQPEKTCYVDFVKVLKEDSLLLNEQIEIYQDARFRQRDLAAKFDKQLKAKQDAIKNEPPKSEKYAKLMEEIIQVNATYTKERYDIELDMQKDVNEAAKKRFNALRKYAIEIAEKHGATQVLVISTDSFDKMDFSDMQKALMLSPVLHYTAGYDITAELKAKADLDKCNHEAEKVYAVDAAGKEVPKLPEDKVTNPDRIDYEVALGATLKLKADFSDIDKTTAKRGPVAAKAVSPVWELKGVDTGELKTLPDGDGAEYTAPKEMPKGAPATGLIVEIEVAPDKARAKSKVLRVRIQPAKDK